MTYYSWCQTEIREWVTRNNIVLGALAWFHYDVCGMGRGAVVITVQSPIETVAITRNNMFYMSKNTAPEELQDILEQYNPDHEVVLFLVDANTSLPVGPFSPELRPIDCLSQERQHVTELCYGRPEDN